MLDLNFKIPDDDGTRNASQLPEPSGFKMLIAMPELEEKTDSGIFIPEASRDREQTASIVGFVLKQGPLAYGDESKFPSGPWCKIGDWVVFRAYSGTRLKIHGKEFRIINDDTVEAVVEDPRGIKRA
jgi:chaperonin GroES